MTQLEDDLDLEILRSINTDITPDPDVLARLRDQVVSAPSARALIAWPKLLAVAVAALTLGVGAGGLVPKLTTTPPPRTSTPTLPTPTVASFTTAAASASLLRTPLSPNADQYLKVVARDVSSGGQLVEVGDDGSVTKVGHLFRFRSTVTTWIPGDPLRPWVRTISTTWEPVDDKARRYQAAHPDTMGPTTSAPERAANGYFDASETDTEGWLNPSQKFLEQLPRDPAALMESARAWNTSQGATNDPQSLLETLARPLASTWVGDPELRAALFTAIGRIDGIQLSPDATVAGQRGTALTGVSQENPELRTEVVFDPSDYRLLAWRFVNDREGSVQTAETTFTSSIVSSAP